MKLYGCHRTRADRVRWALEEAGAAYEYVGIDIHQGEGRSAEFLAMNPSGKVPVLEVEGTCLTESAAICRFVADRYPAAGLMPLPGTVDRGRCDQWCDFAISELEQPLWLMSKHTSALPPARRVAAVLDTAAWEFQRAARVLADGLGSGTWILGDQFTVADILLGHTLAWARALEQALPAGNLKDYTLRLRSRPAFQRMVALSRS